MYSYQFLHHAPAALGLGGGVTPVSDSNRDVRPDGVWFSQGFVLNVLRIYLITTNSSAAL